MGPAARRCRARCTVSVLAQHAERMSAIPEFLAVLSLKGAIVTIDAMGTQKEIAQGIVDRGADCVCSPSKAIKRACTRTRRLRRDLRAPGRADAGHRRIEKRLWRAADASWLLQRRPEWKGLWCIAAITAPVSTCGPTRGD